MSRSLTQPVLIRRTTSPVDAAAAAVRAAFARVRREMQIRRDRQHLRSMPDYILRDVGMHRSEIAAMTRSGREAYRAGWTA